MNSIALLANANFKLNMKRRKLIKPDLNPPFTRLCKEDIKPSTKLFGDDLSKHMAEAKKANDPVILDAIKHYYIELWMFFQLKFVNRNKSIFLHLKV